MICTVAIPAYSIVEISDPSERLQKLSEKHLQALKDGVTSLIVTPTHEEGRTVTTVVRDQMKQEGLITGQEHVLAGCKSSISPKVSNGIP